MPKYPISKDQAELFKKNYHFPAKVSISIRGGGNGKIVSVGSAKTNPTVQVNGGDEYYAELNGYNHECGPFPERPGCPDRQKCLCAGQ